MAATGKRSFEAVAVAETFVLTKAPVSTRQLVMYAGASGDYNRIHYDHAFACAAGLGGVIAHGMLTMGFAAQCVTDWAGTGAIVCDIAGRFLQPVRPDDAVAITLTVTAKAVRDGRHCCDVTLAGAVDDCPVFAGTATVVLPD